MDPETALDLLAGLAEPTTTAEEADRIMAQFDGHEVEAALPVFSRLHDARRPIEIHAAARLLGRWAGRPVAAALVPALGALLREPAVGDLNRLAAAGLLETLGEPVDYRVLLAAMRDLGALASAALDEALRRADHPSAVANLVEQLGRMPREHVLAVVDDIAPADAGRAAPVLAALTHAPDPDVAVSAVAALDRLRIHRPGELARVASAHPDAGVRAEAGRTLARLAVGVASDTAGTGSPAPARPANGRANPGGARAFASGDAPHAGARIVLLAAPGPGGAGDDVLTLHVDATGARGYAISEGVSAERLEAIVDACRAKGVVLAPVSWTAGRGVAADAVERALAGGRLERIGAVAWLAASDGV